MIDLSAKAGRRHALTLQLWYFVEVQAKLESLINATPTGELRNKLTEVNIHLGLALACLREAMALEAV